MRYFSFLFGGSLHRSSANSKIIPQESFSLLMTAQEVLEKAEAESKELLEKTHIECEQLRKQAEAKGFQEGLEILNEKILALDETIKTVRLETMEQIIPLALKAAKKIVGTAYSFDPELIVDVVITVLKSVSQNIRIKLIVSKQDKAILEEKKDLLRSQLEKVESFVIEEGDVTPGGCIIQTERGIINATVENQWRALEAAFEKFATR